MNDASLGREKGVGGRFCGSAIHEDAETAVFDRVLDLAWVGGEVDGSRTRCTVVMRGNRAPEASGDDPREFCRTLTRGKRCA